MSAPNGCKWLIAVEDGFAIELKFEMFNVSVHTKEQKNIFISKKTARLTVVLDTL